MPIEFAQRITWPQLPSELRSRLESLIGSTVLTSQSQAGGFSPGSADIVQTGDGRRLFIKAVSSEANTGAAKLHGREAVIAAGLPASVPAPQMIGHVSWGSWEALVFVAAAGKVPELPWEDGALCSVLDALADMAAESPDLLPGSFPDLRNELAEDFAGFGRMIDDGVEPQDPWVAERLHQLHELALEGIPALAGAQLVHSDLRSDNLIITDAGEILLVDWPWASIGCAWYDGVTVLLEAKIYDPALDVENLVQTQRLFSDAHPDQVTAVLAGLAGFYVDAARRPPIPSLPTLRSYHAQQAAASVDWLKQRLATGDAEGVDFLLGRP